MPNTLDQIVPHIASPTPRTDWLVPIEAKMNEELDRMGLTGPNLLGHPALRDPLGLIHRLVDIGLQEACKPSRLPEDDETQTL